MHHKEGKDQLQNIHIHTCMSADTKHVANTKKRPWRQQRTDGVRESEAANFRVRVRGKRECKDVRERESVCARVNVYVYVMQAVHATAKRTNGIPYPLCVLFSTHT